MKVKSNTLYIIGNGFDLHHGLDTWYSSFGLYLQDNECDIYDLLVKYLGMPELDRYDQSTLNVTEWNEFEVSLANLYFDEIIDDNAEYAADLGSDDYYKDIGAIETYVSEIRDNLSLNLFNIFKAFIRQINYPSLNIGSELFIDKEARFFNFNYTNSLQYYYGVDDTNINYTHNNADSEKLLILGHGFTVNSFVPEIPTPPENATFEELQDWNDWMSDQYDMSIELGKDALFKYFTNSYKNSEKIIKENDAYFKSLSTIDEIIVFGHSLADVDKKYFEKIFSSVKDDTHWFVSCLIKEEMEFKKEKLVSFGIKSENIHPFLVKSLLKINNK